MTKIVFYEKENGESPIKDWLEDIYVNELKRYKKVASYLNILEKLGLSAGEPYIKYLKREKIWEWRPARDRVLFLLIMETSLFCSINL